MYLIDTSVWIPALRKDGPPSIQEQIRKWVRENVASTNGVVRIELMGGCRTDEELSALQERLSGLQSITIDRDINVNNRDVDIDIDVDRDYHGGSYYGYGGCCYHPVATAAAVTSAAIVTAAVVGSMVNTLPPSCSTVVINGFAYQQCGNTWYQPQFSGTTTTYIVVNQPR